MLFFSIEDPVEYDIEGVSQIQVNTKTNLTFAKGLRSIVRQDPNIVLVGEIRDKETAETAVNAALTGHLLLSTLHTNDAATTLPRLLDMKIESYLIASTVNIAIGQRLVRKICSNCKKEKEITPAESESLKGVIPDKLLGGQKKFSVGAGCNKCAKSGYSGRIGVHEVLVVDGPIREAVLRRAPAEDIRKIAIEQEMTPIFEDAVQKAKDGITSLEEILRILHE